MNGPHHQPGLIKVIETEDLRPYRHVDRIAELEKALTRCQKALAILIDPANKGSGIDNMMAWAMCVGAEADARKVLSDAEAKP